MVFSDEELWRGFFEDRFRGASKQSQRRVQVEVGNLSARDSYAQNHWREKNFREGSFRARASFATSHAGVPVLDLHVTNGTASKIAFAALLDGSIMVYDLDPTHLESSNDLEETPRGRAMGAQPLRAALLKELSTSMDAGPALCCLPLGVLNQQPADGSGSTRGSSLVAGFALGRLCAWELSSDQPFVPRCWETAHGGRVSALAALDARSDGSEDSGVAPILLSASSDGLVKAWDMSADRFGDPVETFAGHRGAVVSIASDCHGAVFLTGSHDKTMRLWDIRQGGGRDAQVAQWDQHTWVTCVDFHPTHEHLVFSSDKSVHLWDLRKIDNTPVKSSHKHKKLVSRFRADPLRLASCSLDGSVKVSSLEAPEVRCVSPQTSPRSSSARAPDGFNDPSSYHVSTLRTSADYVLSIDFDASHLVAGCVDGSVEVYDFSLPGNFRRGTPSPSPSPQHRPHCGQPFDIQMVGLQEIEI
jgi:WD40 repeat protein